MTYSIIVSLIAILEAVGIYVILKTDDKKVVKAAIQSKKAAEKKAVETEKKMIGVLSEIEEINMGDSNSIRDGLHALREKNRKLRRDSKF